MSVPEVTGGLSDGGGYRVTAYALETLSPDGRVEEELDLGQIQDVGRDGHAVSFRLQGGTTRILTCSSIEDAGRLADALRQRMPRTPVMSQPLPPVTRQSVEVTGGSGPSIFGVLAGVAVLILVVFLVIIAVRALTDDDDNNDPSVIPDSEPTLTPTEVQEEEPAEPEVDENPTESSRLPVQRIEQDTATREKVTWCELDHASVEAMREGRAA